MQSAIISVLDKKGNKAFKELIDKLGGKKDEVQQHRGGPGKPFEPPVTGPVDPSIPRRKAKHRQPIPPRPRPKEDLLK